MALLLSVKKNEVFSNLYAYLKREKCEHSLHVLMALGIAALASLAPRFFEWCDSTDEIVKNLMLQLKSEVEETRSNAWAAAIDQIKERPVRHITYLAVKTFGDLTILSVIIRTAFKWMVDLFQYLRSLYAQPRAVLEATFNAIRERIASFIEQIKSFSTTMIEFISPEVVYEKLKSKLTNISLLGIGQALKSVWKTLFSAFSAVFQWLTHMLPIITHELYKYAIQLVGCIMHFIDCLKAGGECAEATVKYVGADIQRYATVLF